MFAEEEAAPEFIDSDSPGNIPFYVTTFNQIFQQLTNDLFLKDFTCSF